VARHGADRVSGARPPAVGQSPRQPRLRVQRGRVGSDRREHHHRQAAGGGAGGGVRPPVQRPVPPSQPHHHAPPHQEISIPG
ncbi:unnamed protein product, partial [Caretta caretta]